MAAAVLLGVTLAFVPAASGSPSGTLAWVKTFGASSALQQQSAAVATSPDGTAVFVAGRVTDFNVEFEGPVSDFETIAYDPTNGAKLWQRRYNGPTSGDDFAVAVAVSPDGSRVFVTGSSVGTGGTSFNTDYATVAYDAHSGAQLWVRRYDGPANRGDGPIAIGVSPDGDHVYVTGSSQGASGTAYATISYDAATGHRVWLARSARTESALARGLAVSPDGQRVFVTGTNHPDTKGAWETVAYSAETGVRLWVARADGPSQDIPSAITTNATGSRVFVTGYQFHPDTGFDFATYAYDAATGNRLWVRRYARPGEDIPSAITVFGGTVYVTGHTIHGDPNNPTSDAITIAYSAASGHRRWTAHYQTAADSDTGVAIAHSPNGNTLYVSVEAFNLTTAQDFVTIAYNPLTGGRRWSRRYDNPTHREDSPAGIAVTPDGSRVIVTGTSSGDGGSPLGIPDTDMTTVAYVG